jgi:hypothetical protein
MTKPYTFFQRGIPHQALHNLFFYDVKTGCLHHTGKNSLGQARKTIRGLGAIGEKAGCFSLCGGVNYLHVSVTHAKKTHQLKAHRVIWFMMSGEDTTLEIDHINRDSTDNRFENLRKASRSQNDRNQGLRKDNKSGIVGVCYIAMQSRWMVQIQHEGLKYKSSFLTKHAAENYALKLRNTHKDEYTPQQLLEASKL